MCHIKWIFIHTLVSLHYNVARIVEEKTEEKVSYFIEPDDALPILAIETGYSSILIGTSDNIYLYNLSSIALQGLHSIPYRERLKTPAETGFKELKILHEKLFVYCNNWACRYCIIAFSKTFCILMNNKKNADAISSVSIAYIYPKLLLRIIDLSNHASTLLYDIQGVHMICAFDNTTTLASNMELTLDCRTDVSLPITLLGRSHYDIAKDKLWFTIHTSNGESQMCRFNMKIVNDKFDAIWETCLTPVFETDNDCHIAPKNSTLDYCFAFARNSSSGKLYNCYSFEMDPSGYNCNISGNFLYGWIEYFEPYWQSPSYSMMSNNDIVTQILPVHEYNNTIYTTYGTHQRSNYVYWKNPTVHSTAGISHVLQISSNLGSSRNIATFENNLCYIEGTSVRIIPIACETFYKTCDSLEAGKWASPPGCMWCTDKGNDAAVYENKNKFKRPIRGQCSANQSQLSESSNRKVFSSQIYKEKETDWLMISVLGGVIVMLVILSGIIVREQRKVVRAYTSANERPTELGQNLRPLLTSNTNADENVTPVTMITTLTSSTSRSKHEYGNLFEHINDDIKIDISHLQLQETIGEGNFGIVLRGTYTSPDGDIIKVACKMLRQGEPGVRAFFDEGLTMMNFHHSRVIPFIGISLANGTDPIIVTKFMPNGNLLKYLQNNANTINAEQIQDFAMQIAEGMEYLHSKKFIHRDLAARNCMLDHKMQLKIGDFGLARQCNDQNMYLSCNFPDMPFAWASIEALEFRTFTLKGDIWSYGVVLWELMSKGERPSTKYTPSGVLEFLKQGKRLSRPLDCPEEFYISIMMPCWNADMNKRPSFNKLIELLKEFAGNSNAHPEYHSKCQIYQKL